MTSLQTTNSPTGGSFSKMEGNAVVEENRKILSQKTQKLLETANHISVTLTNLKGGAIPSNPSSTTTSTDNQDKIIIEQKLRDARELKEQQQQEQQQHQFQQQANLIATSNHIVNQIEPSQSQIDSKPTTVEEQNPKITIEAASPVHNTTLSDPGKVAAVPSGESVTSTPLPSSSPSASIVRAESRSKINGDQARSSVTSNSSRTTTGVIGRPTSSTVTAKPSTISKRPSNESISSTSGTASSKYQPISKRSSIVSMASSKKNIDAHPGHVTTNASKVLSPPAQHNSHHSSGSNGSITTANHKSAPFPHISHEKAPSSTHQEIHHQPTTSHERQHQTHLPSSEKVEKPVEEEIFFISSPSKSTTSHLLHKIAMLEHDLAESHKLTDEIRVTNTASNSKFEQLKHQHTDLQMRASRQEKEMRALIEQNDSLRSEHRRTSEIESGLRLKIVELSQPPSLSANNTATVFSAGNALDASDQVSQERIIQQVDEKLGWIAIHLNSHGADRHLETKYLLSYQESLQALKKAVRGIETFSLKSILALCRVTSTVLSDSLGDTWHVLKSSHDLNKRFEKLRDDRLAVDEDATVTIQKLNASHHEKVDSLQKAVQRLSQKLEVALEDKNNLEQANDKLAVENQALAEIAQRPQHVFVNSKPDTKNGSWERQAADLQKRNHDLHVHIEDLNQTIIAWKEENDAVLHELTKVRKDKQIAEKEQLQLLQKVAESQDLLEEEKMRNNKAAELIKSLQDEKSERTTGGGVDLQGILASQLEAIKGLVQPHSNQNVMDLLNGAISLNPSQSAEVSVLKFLKDLEVKSKKYEKSEELAKEQAEVIGKLEEEIIKLRLKSTQTKDKFQVREMAWLEKLKASKVEQEVILKDCEEVTRKLQSYQDQYIAIHALFNKNVSPEDSHKHPLTFAPLFSQIYKREEDATQRCEELEGQLERVKKAFEASSQDLLVQVKQFETLGSESSNTKSRLMEVSAEKARLEVDVKDLQREVVVAQAGRHEAEEKFRVVFERLVEYVQDDGGEMI